MPQHKSCEKRVKTNLKSNRRNVSHKTQMKSSIKKLRSITDKEVIQDELKKRILYWINWLQKNYSQNKAANQKAKLAKYANSLA